MTRFRYHKAASLLGYLVYFNRTDSPPHPRENLIEMLWPDIAPASGRKNLRNLLAALRPVLEPPGVPAGSVLYADRFSVRLNPAAVTCDVHEFEADVRQARRSDLSEAERLGWWLQAAQRYQGPLMPGYYEDWIGPEALRLNSLLEVVQQVVPALQERGEWDLALPLVQRAVAVDPLNEATTWALMQALVAQQQPSQALHAYRELERRLQEEWGETPSGELQAFVRQLKKVPSPVPASIPPEEARPFSPLKTLLTELPEPAETERGFWNSRLIGAAFTVLTNTRFFGRTVEVGRLIKMLTTHRTRLITLTGSGGTGKTRLALGPTARLVTQTAGTNAALRCAVFVALGEVTDPTRICEAILGAMGVPPITDVDPLEQLSAELAGEQAIL